MIYQMILMLEKRIDEINKKAMILEENMKTLFSIICGKVSEKNIGSKWI